jgi:hypothetical protein
MRKQVVLAPKQRPPGPGVQVVVRLQPDPLSALDKWAAKQNPPARKLDLGHMAKISSTPKKASRSTRARELAAEVIDKMIDPSMSADERDQRRRRLTKGPPEFREHRVDLPKIKR